MNDHDSQPNSLSLHQSVAAPQCALRRSLPGEYLSLALMLHAGLGAMAWGASSVRDPAGLLFVASGVWIVGRGAGVFAQRAFTPLATVGLLVGAFIVRQQGLDLPAPGLAIFSSLVMIAMLAAVLVVDTVELAMSPAGSAIGRRLRSWNWHRIAVWGCALAFLVYMVVVPTTSWIIERMHPPESGRVLLDMSLAEQVRVRTMEAMAAAWFLALGATIGSFLNVVAYRMPRGESLVAQRSRCPQCGTQIKGRDNVPVLGWLLLNGRCRACQSAISFRYPIVEAITAAIFLLVYFVELISGGANIPVRHPNSYHGVVWIIFYTKWDLVALYLFHGIALSALLAWTLIDVDRQRVPWRARWVVGVILFVLPLLRPDLLPVPWLREAAFGLDVPSWLSVIATSVLGGVSGALLGWLAARAIRVRPQRNEADSELQDAPIPPPGGHMVSAGMIVGLSVGWQAAVGVWLIALALRPVTHGVARRWLVNEPPMTAILLVAYLMQLISWRWLTTDWWPSYRTTPLFWAVTSIGLAALWLVNRLLPHVQCSDDAGGAAATDLPSSASATS